MVVLQCNNLSKHKEPISINKRSVLIKKYTVIEIGRKNTIWVTFTKIYLTCAELPGEQIKLQLTYLNLS